MPQTLGHMLSFPSLSNLTALPSVSLRGGSSTRHSAVAWTSPMRGGDQVTQALELSGTWAGPGPEHPDDAAEPARGSGGLRRNKRIIV